MRTVYEWDWEQYTADEYEDIEDHAHSDAIEADPFAPADGMATRLVLVRNTGDDVSGLVLRLWAYVQADGTLPQTFDDAGAPTGYRVPQRYHDELRRWVAKHGNPMAR